VARFYFNLVGPRGVVADPQGVEVRDTDWEQVIARIMDEIRNEEPELFDLGPGWSIEVVDEDGRTVGTLPI
jgi:hypothetical protein